MTIPGGGPAVRVHSQLHQQAARNREQAQNVPRPARIRFNVNTVGIGESRLTGNAAINFGALMLEEPTFSWGVQALDKLGIDEIPLCTAVVLGYTRNKQGLYRGANLGFRVESAQFAIRLKFSLTFEGSTLRTTAGVTPGAPAVRGQNVYTGPTVQNVSEL